MPKQDPNAYLDGVTSPQDSAPAVSARQDPNAFLSDVQSPIAEAAPQASTPAPAGGDWVGTAINRGTANLLGLPGTLEELGDKYLPQWAVSPLGNIRGAPPARIFPTGSEIASHLKDQAAPQGRVQNLIAGGLQGVPAGALTGGAGLVANPVAGVAAEGAHELMPNQPLAPIAAGIAAGGLTQAGLSAFSGSALGRIANGIHDAADMETAGGVAQDSARRWLTRVPQGDAPVPGSMQAQETQAWAPFDAKVGTATPANIDNFRSAVESITSKGGSLAGLVKMFRPNAPDSINKWLSSMDDLGETTGEVPQLTLGEVRDLQQTIGAAKGIPSVVNSIGKENLSKMYHGVMDDIRTTASENDALPEFTSAQETSNRLNQFKEGVVDKMIGGTTPNLAADADPGKLATKLLTGGGQNLQALRAQLPEAADALAAAHLRSSPQTWSKLSPTTQAALIPDPQVRQIVSAVAPSKASSALNPLVSPVKHQAGLMGGEVGGTILGHLLDAGGSDWLHGAYGAAAGAAYPLATKTLMGLIRRPNLLSLPVQGGVVGSGINSQQ